MQDVSSQIPPYNNNQEEKEYLEVCGSFCLFFGKQGASAMNAGEENFEMADLSSCLGFKKQVKPWRILGKPTRGAHSWHQNILLSSLGTVWVEHTHLFKGSIYISITTITYCTRVGTPLRLFFCQSLRSYQRKMAAQTGGVCGKMEMCTQICFLKFNLKCLQMLVVLQWPSAYSFKNTHHLGWWRFVLSSEDSDVSTTFSCGRRQTQKN